MIQQFFEIFTRRQQAIGYRRAFLTRRQFEREVTIERIRASRRGIPFCIVTLTLSANQSRVASAKLARLLRRNLRITDEKASFSATEFAVLLVDTPQFGGLAVIDRLGMLFDDQGLNVEMELKVHDPSTLEPHDYSGSNANEASSKWVAPITQEVATVGASCERAAWTEPVAWNATADANNERRLGSRGLTDLSISSRSNEIVSSDDPLVKMPLVYATMKRCIDIVGAAVGLLFAGPFLLVAMAIIRLTTPGAAIFRQTREGRGGQPFTIYKLRTMVADAESAQQSLRELSHRDGPAFKIKSDPRVTKVGNFLRATCMDELPQLVNVLRGDMSIVGPRPLPWHESRACSHWHRRRLDVRPGLTCFWQIDKARAETFDDWMRLDLEYVDRGNLWIDAFLIYRTLAVTLTGRGSH